MIEIVQNTYDSVPFSYLKDDLYIPLKLSAYSPENSTVVMYLPLSRADSNSITRKWFFLKLKCLLIGIDPKIKQNT